jgi:hypothetical protein
MKLQAQLETSKYSESLLHQEISVKPSQRRDSLIESQRKMIENLRAEVAAYKRHPQDRQEVQPDGKFLDYLEDFQVETVSHTQARLTAETEALLTKHERKRSKGASPVKFREEYFDQSDLLE